MSGRQPTPFDHVWSHFSGGLKYCARVLGVNLAARLGDDHRVQAFAEQACGRDYALSGLRYLDADDRAFVAIVLAGADPVTAAREVLSWSGATLEEPVRE